MFEDEWPIREKRRIVCHICKTVSKGSENRMTWMGRHCHYHLCKHKYCDRCKYEGWKGANWFWQLFGYE